MTISRRTVLAASATAPVLTGLPASAAPQRIIATHYVNNVAAQGVAFQRPLCPYPERAEYVGGNPNDPGSFECVAHHDPFDPRNIGPQRAYK